MLLSSIHLGHLLVPVSAVTAAAGLVLALLLSLRTAPRAGVSPDALWNAGLFTVVAALVASRVLLVARDPRAFLRYPLLVLMLPSLTYAGALLTAVLTALYLRHRRIPLRRALDAWAAPGALLWAAVAFGHFAEGTDPGLPTALPWGIRPAPAAPPEHPVALYTALFALLLGGLALRLTGTPRFTAAGSVATLTLVLAGGAQFFFSFLREPLLAVFSPTPLVEPLQWIALAIMAAGGVLFAARRAAAPTVAPGTAIGGPHAF